MVRSMMKLNNKKLVEQIEEKVGSDLQYIRLNGAVVGGIVGIIIAVLNYFRYNLITLINKLTRSRVHKTKIE
jgi:uncharacterized membrane-anchored protein YjiN (DUF445 family)